MQKRRKRQVSAQSRPILRSADPESHKTQSSRSPRTAGKTHLPPTPNSISASSISHGCRFYEHGSDSKSFLENLGACARFHFRDGHNSPGGDKGPSGKLTGCFHICKCKHGLVQNFRGNGGPWGGLNSPSSVMPVSGDFIKGEETMGGIFKDIIERPHHRSLCSFPSELDAPAPSWCASRLRVQGRDGSWSSRSRMHKYKEIRIRAYEYKAAGRCELAVRTSVPCVCRRLTERHPHRGHAESI